jgi:uncharacterized OB-fold protein
VAIDLTTIPALADVEPVKSTKTPLHLDYEYTAGVATSQFLRAVKEKRLLGLRCPKCQKVYIPSRGACPTDGVPTTEEVELPHTGVVTTFCVVNVQFYGQQMEVPYVSANILVDGADLPLFGLIQEMPADEVRMGLRVEAVWKDDDELTTSLENIKWWKPTGEPDADPSVYGGHA